MIEKLKAYSAYKDSGEPWLGSIPKHWDIVRTKSILRERSVKGFPDEPLLAATQTKGVVRKEDYENRTVLALKDLHLLKLVRAGDFVISLRSFQGGIEFARHQGIISPAYTILYSVNPEDHGYLAHLFKSKPYIESLGLFVTGIRQGQNIDYTKLSRSYLPLPPTKEQAAIVRFLDHADRRIRRAIRAKRKLITLLNEQQQVIIHQAVTRGLDPDVRLKPSGVEWLGDVPEHWEIMPLRHLLSFGPKNGVSPPSSNVGGALSFSISAVRSGRICVEGNEKYISLDAAHISRFLIRTGDILLVRGNGNVNLVAKCGLVEECPDRCVFPDIIMKILPNTRMQSNFMVMAINSPYVSNQVQALAKTTNGTFKVSGASVRSLVLAVPPCSEQIAILDYLSSALKNIDLAKDRAGAEILLLLELRTRLISDVVTGKLDVREAAAQLPSEEDTAEAIDDTEILSDEEEAPEAAEPEEVEA